MSINITERQRSCQHENYVVDMDRIRQESKRADRSNDIVIRNDTVDISRAGRNALENKMSALSRAGQNKAAGKLSPVSSFSVISDFERAVSAEKEEGIKSNTFDYHVNQMVSAYKRMRNGIEEKYADTDREQQYYVADDGSIQKLTKEKELEMLDKAYEKHSKFMAASTEIWGNLQGFKPQITYHSKSADTVQSVSADNTGNSGIKEQAYQAFMYSVNNENIRLLSQSKEGLSNIKLDLGISKSARNELNHIWDYYKAATKGIALK